LKDVAIFLLDNVDSFTYNLVDELERICDHISVFRNTVPADTIIEAIEEVQQHQDVVLVLSPGPGEPANAGCMPELLKRLAGKIPILGICLGHQAMVEHYGGKVGRAPVVMHGKASMLSHSQSGVFANLPNPLPIARYHSLVALDLPNSLQVLASIDNQVMAIWQPTDKMMGFQFHPESILTTAGSQLLINTLTFLTSGEHTI
jgi:anthranilate synthase component 2